MRLVTTPRVTFLRDLADLVQLRTARGRVVVAVDGPLRSGKTAFADDLGAVLEERGATVFRARMEGFHRSREAQAAFGPDTAERYVDYGFDESALRRVLVEPFRLAGSTGFVTRVRDVGRDAWVEPKWLTGPEDAVLLIDGRFLLRDRLRPLWDFSIAIAGEPVDPADVIAYGRCDPRRVADVVVDLADQSRPHAA
ncbi:hypothetical protein M3147_05450 [Agromyces mediolanus]|uniref:hypothetical protein n=1 Tax=Agromyces mediolanus TaxID=41986 RepID=UPI00203ED936|nr:hypothetical protein [Agromyces mediolanus]MCM3656695.1 hypothetical protein [Agromyces mediolanus]